MGSVELRCGKSRGSVPQQMMNRLSLTRIKLYPTPTPLTQTPTPPFKKLGFTWSILSINPPLTTRALAPAFPAPFLPRQSGLASNLPLGPTPRPLQLLPPHPRPPARTVPRNLSHLPDPASQSCACSRLFQPGLRTPAACSPSPLSARSPHSPRHSHPRLDPNRDLHPEDRDHSPLGENGLT